MALSAANADGGIALTAVIARRKDGRLVMLFDQGGKAPFVEYPIQESSDAAFDLYERLKKSKGEGGKYSEATLFHRSKSRRGRTKFT